MHVQYSRFLCSSLWGAWSTSWTLDTTSRPAHPEVAEGLHLSALTFMKLNIRWRHRSKSKAPQISELPNLTARTPSHGNFLLLLCLFLCVLTWSMIYLNYLMACTVFAQTLKTRCCCVCSSEGVNLSATSGYTCQNPFLPPRPTSAPLLPSFLLSTSGVTFASQSITVLVAPRCVMMMKMSLSLVLIVFLKVVYYQSWLDVLLCEVLALLKKSMLKEKSPEGLVRRKKKGMMGRGLCWLEGCGTWWQSEDLVPFVSFCCKCSSC